MATAKTHPNTGSVLVTGAAGGMQGATGRTVALTLLKRGVPVRAFVRVDYDLAAALRAAGAEVVVGDMLLYKDMVAAAQGAKYMYFCFPVGAGLLEATAVAALAAREAGMAGIVNNSQWVSDLAAPSPQSRQHALSEQIFDSFGTPTVHLRGANYAEQMGLTFLKQVQLSGRLSAPSVKASDEMALIAGADMGAAAANVLRDFHKYEAGQVIPLAAELIDMTAITAAFSKALGKQVVFESVTPAAWGEGFAKLLPPGRAPDPATQAHLLALWGMVAAMNEDRGLLARMAQQGMPQLEAILDHKPITFADWLGPYVQGRQ